MPVILGVSKKHVAVLPTTTSDVVAEVRSLDDLARKPVTLKIGKLEKHPWIPRLVKFDGNDLYVVCCGSIFNSPMQPGAANPVNPKSGLGLCKFSLNNSNTGQPVWRRKLVSNMGSVMGGFSSPVIGQRYIVLSTFPIMTLPGQSIWPTATFIIDQAYGKVVQKIQLKKAKAPQKGGIRRMQVTYGVGHVVIVGDRLCVTTPEGITVYKGK